MSTIADAFTTDSALQIGNGLAVHENVGGGTSESAFPLCGTKRNPRSRYNTLEGSTYVVTCEKCRIAIDKANKLAAQEAREAAMAAEEAPATVEAVLTNVLAEVVATTPVAETTEAPVFAKGDVVNGKDGNQYVVRRVNANGTIRLVDAAGNKINRKAETLTKA